MANSLRNKIKHFCYKGELSESERDRLLNALDDEDRINSELKPSEDCISREAAIKQCGFGMTHLLITDCLRRLPSVTPKTRWIPVSERLPEDYIHVLCQFTLNGMGECYLAHGVFHVVGGLVMTCNEVIAWMPLPEPYKEESEDKE